MYFGKFSSAKLFSFHFDFYESVKVVKKKQVKIFDKKEGAKEIREVADENFKITVIHNPQAGKLSRSIGRPLAYRVSYISNV